MTKANRNKKKRDETPDIAKDPFYDKTKEEADEETHQWYERQLAKYGIKKSTTPTPTTTTTTPPNNKKKNEIYLQRVCNEEHFAEAAIINGIPKFLVANNGTGEISAVDFIPLGKENKLAKPLPLESYINKPYTFNSQLELDNIIAETKKQTLAHLYKMVKRIWKKYVDADDFHISICAADTIFTYFQDKAGMTHYLFFVGGPGSGKSNNLEVFHFLAYRNMTSAGITPATLYRFHGGREEGVGTICEDEANDLDQKTSEDKLRFYKNGYAKGKPVIRNDDTPEAGRIPRKYFTFGWKALAAERLPDSIIAKGFMDRVIPMPCTYGFPEYDITEVANPMGEEKFIQLLAELDKARNLLLVYRILHNEDKFPDIPLNIIGREKQLFKPILRIFNGTETQTALEVVISNYISERRAANVDSQHAYIFRTVVELINEQGSHELASKDIWDKARDAPGEFLYNGTSITGRYETVEYGILTQKLVTKICREVLKAKRGRDNTRRKLLFDKGILNNLNKLFNSSLDVKVTQVTQVTLFQGTNYQDGCKANIESGNSTVQNDNISRNSHINVENNTSLTADKLTEPSEKASQVSQASPIKKCPFEGCKFRNIHPDEIEHHFKFTHEEE